MNVLSLFSGVGGLELGLERAEMTVVGQVEIDPFCREVLERHWPEVTRHDDVRTAVGWWRSAVRPGVDVVAGGFPCQPFSGAGRRGGIADERWGWPWMAAVVAALRPRYVVCENVEALLRDSDAMAIILGDLAAIGFDVEWDVVSAHSLGASHLRERLFVVAHPRGKGLEGGWFRGAVADSAGWPPEPPVARMADGVPRRLVRDAIHALGNAVVPAVAERVGRLIMAHNAMLREAA